MKTPFYEQIQAHYDLNDDFFALFLDPTRTYSCAYFAAENMSLEQAQLAKIDLSLEKCDLRSGLRLLDIGCGWGTTAIRAAEKYNVDVVGLTLSTNQYTYGRRRLETQPLASGSVDFRLQGWEEFEEPVDRIVSIGAFEHFRKQRHRDFFAKCRSILTPGGRMMLHTIVYNSFARQQALGLTITEEDISFARFIRAEIFPGGEICNPERIEALASEAGFEVFHTQSLRLHYARTLDAWAANLQAANQRAIELTSPAVYETFMKYLVGCASRFRQGSIDIIQFCMK